MGLSGQPLQQYSFFIPVWHEEKIEINEGLGWIITMTTAGYDVMVMFPERHESDRFKWMRISALNKQAREELLDYREKILNKTSDTMYEVTHIESAEELYKVTRKHRSKGDMDYVSIAPDEVKVILNEKGLDLRLDDRQFDISKVDPGKFLELICENHGVEFLQQKPKS